MRRSFFDDRSWLPLPRGEGGGRGNGGYELNGVSASRFGCGSAVLCLCVFALTLFSARSALPASNNFSDVAAVFEKHCLDCHSAPDPEGKLLLESFDALMKGGETGPA